MITEKDLKYMRVAGAVAAMSKAVNKHIGAVLVKDNTVVSIGYNGPPRGIEEVNNLTRFPEQIAVKIIKEMEKKYGRWDFSSPDQIHPDFISDPRYLLGYGSGEGMKWMIDAHAERNAIINAARSGVSTVGTTLYAFCGIPCKECAIELINAGIKRVVCFEQDMIPDDELTIENTNDYNFYLSRWLFNHAGIELEEIEREKTT